MHIAKEHFDLRMKQGIKDDKKTVVNRGQRGDILFGICAVGCKARPTQASRMDLNLQDTSSLSARISASRSASRASNVLRSARPARISSCRANRRALLLSSSR